MCARETSKSPESGKVFLEPGELEDRFGLWLKIDRVLEHKITEFQTLDVVEAGPLGRLLLLDGSIQLSEYDETAYHEMLAHVPMLSHPDPRRVLIVGGGDGGTLREVLKHPKVEKVQVCEIDEQVIAASQKFLPGLGRAFSDPRVETHTKDGSEFMARNSGAFDVILVDCSDPDGPAGVLFSRKFHENMKKALRPGGVAAAQCESFYLYAPLIKKIFSHLPELFPVALYYLAMVPTYLSGIIGFAFCSLGPDPLSPPDPGRLAALGEMEYYTPALHRAAFMLPGRCLKLLPPEVARRQGGGPA